MNLSNEDSDNGGGERQPDPLVLREPQLHQAEASLKSAHASLDLARLNLARTVLTAPYNCRVRSISASPGQLVNASTPLARLYATDVAEIDVSLQMSDLSLIKVPGAKAEITLDSGDDIYHWEGYVHRSVGVLDEIGRLAQVIVRVDSPYHKTKNDQPDLNVGSFVKVEIAGETLANVFSVPRSVLRENSTLWIANSDNTLEIRTVSTAWMNSEEVFIDGGLSPGERIVATPLAGVSDGMKLRPMTEDSES